MSPEPPKATRPKPKPLTRTATQVQRQVAAELGAAQEEAAQAAQTKAQADAARLAQVANLLIAGHSLTSIGAQIGATPDEVDRMLNQDMARYVRNQPALRTFVRNYLSSKYTALLETDWDIATDKSHKEKLEHQDRVLKILKDMGRLHGAEAPVQSEVKVDAAPEAVDALVARIAASQGMGYDTSIFDTVPGEVIHQAGTDVRAALAAAEKAADAPQDTDENWESHEDHG